MFNLGFGGQFGGGFLQSPDATVVGAPSGVVTYAIGPTKFRKRDDSQRRDRYGSLDRWGLAFPTSPSMDGSVQFHGGSGR